jgi:AraC-like DNA-binding protein
MTNVKGSKRYTLKALLAYKKLLDNQNGHGDCTDKVSAQMGVTRNALQKAFKQQFGYTVRQYKLKVRMKRSRELLAAGKDIKEISYELHYTTIRAFSHAFKRYYGVTPSDYVNSLPL